jgi:hypothetical protein
VTSEGDDPAAEITVSGEAGVPSALGLEQHAHARQKAGVISMTTVTTGWTAPLAADG